MKKTLLSLATIVLLSTVFMTSCKKGEDDPAISFRSRDARVTGSWTLSSSEKTNSYNTTTTNTNNVNTDKSVIVNNNSTTTSIDGTAKSVTTIETNNENRTQTSYDYYNNTFKTITTDNKTTNTTVDKYTYVVNLEINKDMTYTVTYTETKISSTFNHTTISEGTTITDKSDTIYNPSSTKSWSESGEWAWLDSKKDKVIIMAGPMNGYVKRLSNKEIIIEDTFSNNSNSTDYTTSSLQTYDDINIPYKSKIGNKKVVTNNSNNNNNYQVWVAK